MVLEKSSSVCIITARGGSKRIPRKNIKEFCGKPIIAYSIEAALKSGCFDEVMCSTDDIEIAEVAKRCGASVPFMRSEATANDFATTADVLKEVIAEYQKRGRSFDYFCCLYPTAPFVNAERIRQGLEMMIAAKANGAMSVVQYSYPIQRALTISGRVISMREPVYLRSRSQDLEPMYHDAGQYYWYRTSAFLQNPNIMTSDPVAIVTPEEEVQDIDTPDDWKMAEMKYRLTMTRNVSNIAGRVLMPEQDKGS